MDSYLIRSRHVVLPGEVISGSIHVAGEKIAGIFRENQPLPTAPVIDVGDDWILPGLVDTHVHINEPGRTEWEGFHTATASAVAGGITTLVDMPLNSSPVTTTLEAFEIKLAAARAPGQLAVDCGFHAGLIPGNEKDIPSLLKKGVLGVKAFMVYSGIPDFPAATQKELAAVMPVLAKHNVPLLAHAELDGPVLVPDGDDRSYRRYLASRPSEWEVDAIGMLIALCRETRCPIHIVHLATRDALELIREAKAEGLPLTVETCPHYLYFCAEEIPDGKTQYKCAPPIREKEHREALWNALLSGEIDMIASDHSPCPPSMKELESGNFAKAWGGISSLQLGLPIIWTQCRKRGIPLENISAWMSRNPAILAGLYPQKGVLEAGSDADFAIFDPEKAFTVDANRLAHRHKITPYADEKLYGQIKKTYLRGRVVYDAEQGGCEYLGRIILHP
ncbi:MAG TPA: allantoinase AllB [Kiritimatiellia bacterium]|nr:allantoinase AllB [Kiritimatiellia bacterium]